MPDEPAIPAPEVTDPGFKQHNMKVGANEEFTLPDVTPLINAQHAVPWMLWGNERWVRFNWLFRGIAGTGVDWFVFFAEIGKAYPRQTALVAALILIPLEEKYSDHPYLSNTFRYTLEVIDPVAAEKIYAPKQYPADPIGDASEKLLADATAEYVKSAEYALLKQDTELDAQRQIRKRMYLAAGMLEDAAAVDAEIVAACEERKAKRRPVVTAPEPEPVPEPEPEPVPEPVPEQVETPTPVLPAEAQP